MSPLSSGNILFSFFRYLGGKTSQPLINIAQTLLAELPQECDLIYHHWSNWKYGAGLHTLPASHFPNHTQWCKPLHSANLTVSSLSSAVALPPLLDPTWNTSLPSWTLVFGQTHRYTAQPGMFSPPPCLDETWLCADNTLKLRWLAFFSRPLAPNMLFLQYTKTEKPQSHLDCTSSLPSLFLLLLPPPLTPPSRVTKSCWFYHWNTSYTFALISILTASVKAFVISLSGTAYFNWLPGLQTPNIRSILHIVANAFSTEYLLHSRQGVGVSEALGTEMDTQFLTSWLISRMCRKYYVGNIVLFPPSRIQFSPTRYLFLNLYSLFIHQTHSIH